MTSRASRVVLFSVALLGAILAVAPVQAANPKITEVESKSGVKAWLVQSRQLPLVSVKFSFEGGVETDSQDKQGRAVLAASLITQGAGKYGDTQFQDRLAARSIGLSVSATRDFIVGDMKLLRRDREEAFRLLGLALTKPRFDPHVVEREKANQVVAIKAQTASPAWQGRVALYGHVFAGHPYSYRSLGLPQTVESLLPEELKMFVRERFVKKGLRIAIVGDISAQEATHLLDVAFGALPAYGMPAAVSEVRWPAQAKRIAVRREGAQTSILWAGPMLRRQEPDWYAAQIANYILGGGGFTSRLMDAVRAKGGMTYGISTSLASMARASLLSGSVDVDNGKVSDVLSLMRRVMVDFFENGVTEAEVAAAQDYITGSLPLALTSTDDIAGVLLSLQQDHLGADFLDRRENLYRAVTKEDVHRVIRSWYNPDMISYSLVGEPQDVIVDQTNEYIKE